jgi:opacity protein-like surface antigen
MPHRRTFALVLAAAAALALGAAAPAPAQEPGLIPTVSKIRFNGIGAFYTGMTRKQAREAAGTVYYTTSRVGACLYWDFGPPNTGQGPYLRFHKGRIGYVDTGRKGFATRKGVEVGDRVREVRRKYKRLNRRQDLGGGYELLARKGKTRLIFTIVNKRVSRIAGGVLPWVLWQECV